MPGAQQEENHRQDFVFGEPIILLFRLHQRGDQVIPWAVCTLLDEPSQIAHETHNGGYLEKRVAAYANRYKMLCPAVELVVVFRRHAQDAPDDGIGSGKA